MNTTHDLFHSIQQLARQLTKQLNTALEPFDIYSSEWAILYVLKKNGPLTQKEIADYLSIEPPPVTRTIKKLVEKKYVLQIKGEDKRTNRVFLTDFAIQQYAKWEAAVLLANQGLLKQLPIESQKTLQHIIFEWIHSLAIKEEKK
ncbi:MarR family transcriptional regulator [Niallia sp. FSL R7-0648]|uniref:MarR family winged helix-turn-helix transcriptional regulator n=1 Tax=Niallia TaxID=2837506 RepID=UPI000BA545F7|nr:MarR family transcriptional regulator [Niallia circulans]MCM2980399.1 MarR family transcriptional regulator [Niallia circulans]NRG32294.1 MarR family transcriptional regulator [Niallia circulans]PAD27569.1 MarR family transcriptional regulator [Niallia circulans]